MLEMVTFEGRRRVRSVWVVCFLLVLTIALVVGIFPSIEQSGAEFEQILESYPESFRTAFAGSVSEVTSIEGYLSVELYQLIWLLFLGSYVAYAAANSIAGDVENHSFDILLTYPVSRTRIVVAKFLAMTPVIVVVNVVAPVAVLVSVALVDQSLDVERLLVLHGLSIIYLYACAAVGILASVVALRVRLAQGAAIAVVFGMYILDTLTRDTDYEWLGDLAFTRYIDPGEVLTTGEIDAWGAVALLAAACLLVVVAAEVFERRDIPG
jgi:ABC-2 type transport system permease protein